MLENFSETNITNFKKPKKMFRDIAFVFFLLCISFILIPWGFIGPTFVGGGTFFEYKGVTYFIILLTLLIFLFQNHNFKSNKTSFSFPIILISIASIVSLYNRTNVSQTTEFLLLFCCVVGVGFLSSVFANNSDKRRLMLIVLVIFSFLLALYGLYQVNYLFKANILQAKQEGLQLGVSNRLTSVLTSPSVYASFVLLIWPIVLYLLWKEKNKLVKILFAIVLLVLLYSFLQTYSKAGYLIFLIQLIVMFFYFAKRSKLLLVSTLGILFFSALLTAVLILFGFSNPPALTGMIDSAYTSLMGRVSIWNTTINMFIHNPLTGAGAGAFKSTYFKYQYDGFFSTNAHSSYLQLFAETGILGGLAFLTLMIYLVAKCCFVNKALNLSKFIGFGTLAFAIHNIFDSIVYTPLIAYTFALVVGIAFAQVGNPLIRHRDFPRIAFISGFVLFFTLSIFMNVAYYLEIGGINRTFEGEENGIYYLQLATALNPVKPDYHGNLAQAYSITFPQDTKKRINRIVEARRASYLEPYNPAHYADLSYFYSDENQRQLAIYFMKKAYKVAPKQPFYPYFIGKLYYEAANVAKAKEYFNKAVLLAKYYRNDYIKQSYRPRGTINPTDPFLNIAKAYVYLGDIALTEGKEEESLDFYNKAISFKSDLSDAYAGIATIELRRKKYKSAAEKIEKALQIDSDNSFYWYLYGKVNESAGNINVAKDLYRRAIQLDPNFQLAKDALNEIQKEDNGE